MASRGRRGSDEHREYEDMAVAHVVGGLTLDEGRVFRSHLLECTACRARVGELRAIAHDLADVERDERRERAAQRTEIKEREAEEAEVAPPTRRFHGRTTAIVAAGLVVLMALSAWNFVLRSQLQAQDDLASRLRAAADVIQQGTRWQVLAPSADERVPSAAVEGHVTTLDRELVVMVGGLAAGAYRLSLLDGDLDEIHSVELDVRDGTLFRYVDDIDVTRARQLTLRADGPDGATTVFAAEHVTARQRAPADDAGAQLEAVGADDG